MSFKDAIGVTYSVYKIKKASTKIIEKKNYTVVDLFLKALKKNPQGYLQNVNSTRINIINLNKTSNQIANWGLNYGLKIGDCVPIMLENSSYYIAVWLGLAKIGVQAVLINTNQIGDTLTHSLNLAYSQSSNKSQKKVLITSHCYCQTLQSINLDNTIQILTYEYGAKLLNNHLSKFNSLNEELIRFNCDIPKIDISHLTCHDPLFYIFTSGTTGLPKAAKISH